MEATADEKRPLSPEPAYLSGMRHKGNYIAAADCNKGLGKAQCALKSHQIASSGTEINFIFSYLVASFVFCRAISMQASEKKTQPKNDFEI